MKTIKYEDEFKAANGYPYPIPDPDPAVHVKAREEAQVKRAEAEVKHPDVAFIESVQWMMPRIDATFAQAVIWFADNIWHAEPDGKGVAKKKVSPTDSGHAYAVIKAFSAPMNGKVQLENAPYEWLIKALDSDEGTAAFHVTSAVILERLGDLVEDRAITQRDEPTPD